MQMTGKIIIIKKWMEVLLRMHPMFLKWKNIDVFELAMFNVVV